MPVIVGAAGTLLIVILLFLMFMSLWLMIRLEQQSRGWPLVLHKINDVAVYLRDRNLDLVRALVHVGESVLSWASDQIHAGISVIVNSIVGPLQAVVVANQNAFIYWRDNIIKPTHELALQTASSLANVINQRIIPAEKRIATTQGEVTAINTRTIPALAASIAAVNAAIQLLITKTITPLSNLLSTLITYTHNTLAPEVARHEVGLNGLERTVTTVVTMPGTGLADRTKGIELDLSKIMAWAGAIGLTIPIAANLAKLGRNPCWCTTEGPQQDMAFYSFAALQGLL